MLLFFIVIPRIIKIPINVEIVLMQHIVHMHVRPQVRLRRRAEEVILCEFNLIIQHEILLQLGKERFWLGQRE